MPSRQQPRRASVATVASSNGDGGDAADTASSRRLRKRELDRRCQRMARERTKNRIAYLEELVEEFRLQDSSGQVASLMNQLSDMSKERDALAKTLQGIQNSIQSHQSLVDSSTKASQPDRADSNSAQQPGNVADAELRTSPTAKGLVSDSGSILDVREKTQDLDGFGSVQPISPPSLPIDPPSMVPVFEELEDPIMPRTNEECECKPSKSCSGSMNVWRYANKVLIRPTESSRDINNLEDLVADDAPVRALLEGWDTVERTYGGRLPPSWQKLKEIDSIIFPTCNIRERLAIMRVMHKLMRYHTDPNPERRERVPAWYMQRPSQTIAHSYAIDYFAWPGLRERFVFYQHRYCGNLFWKLFCSSLRILWPFEFRDCYTRNLQTGQYQISPVFDDRIGDINAWTMDSDIFKRWPEFVSDMPRFNPIPGAVSLSAIQQAADIAGFARSNRVDRGSEPQDRERRDEDELPSGAPFHDEQFLDIWGAEPWTHVPKGMDFLEANHYHDMANMDNVLF